MSQKEEYDEINWKDRSITWLKRVRGTSTLICLRCGGRASIIKLLHFYHEHKNCIIQP